MFLIDNESLVESQNWNVSFAENLESTWSCYTPVKLPILKVLSDTVLRTWIDYEYTYLPEQLSENIDQVVQTILKNSDDGIPIPAFREICNLCDYEWLEEWLKIC